MKKLLSILLVFILLLVLAAGCFCTPSVADTPTTQKPTEKIINWREEREYRKEYPNESAYD